MTESELNVFHVISHLTERPKIANILKLCKFYSITDFLNFNDKSIDNIQEYVRMVCAMMPVDEREIYLDDEDIEHPEDYFITPGIRNRLLKAVAINLTCIGLTPAMPMGILNQTPQLIQNCEIENEPKKILTNSVNTHTAFILNASNNESICENKPIKIIEVKSQAIPDNEIVFNEQDIGYQVYYESVKRMLQNFFSAHQMELKINPKKDFDLEFHFNDIDPKKSFGHYVCFNCNKRKLKFTFTLGGSIIYGPIRSHLKTHHDYQQDENKKIIEKRKNSSFTDEPNVKRFKKW